MKKRGHIKAPTSISFLLKTFPASVVLVLLTASRARGHTRKNSFVQFQKQFFDLFVILTCNQLFLGILDLLMNVGKKSSTCLTKNVGFLSVINVFVNFAQIQFFQLNLVPLLSKPYVNEVTLKEQKLSIEQCQPINFQYTSLESFDLLML